MTDTAAASTRRLLGELEQSGIRLGLDAMRKLMKELGEPHLSLPHVLVAGTNGKGSTAACLTSILVAAGYRTGLYTSPHLESVRERLRLDGRSVTTAELARRLERVTDVASAVLGARPTYFEALTAAAFDLFADESEIAVMEVGLGGRLDATNVGEPIAALISEIGVDHVDYLGATERDIAREKAGVMRRGRPVVVSVSGRSTLAELKRSAAQVGALWFDAGTEVGLEVAGGGDLDLVTARRSYRVAPPLAGTHQRRNLGLAVCAAEVLADRGWSRISAAAIERGVGRCRWPGRLEQVDLPGGTRVLLDGAHNPQAAEALRSFLDGEYRRDGYRLLFGALEDKDFESVLPVLAEGASKVIVTAPNSPRAVAPAALIQLLPGRPVIAVEDAARALDTALDGAERRVVVCGSIYLVGEVRRLLSRRFGTPVAAVDVDVAGNLPAVATS